MENCCMNERKVLGKPGKLRCLAKANSSGVFSVAVEILIKVCVVERLWDVFIKDLHNY